MPLAARASSDMLKTHRRVLLLQGPMGHFFNRLRQWLTQHGATVFKINFNGGDRWFHRGPNTVDYTGTLGDFDDWLIVYVATHRIDAVVCFGDCREYHRIGRRVAKEHGLPFYVFEEGYVRRPDYITLELDGANGYSSLACDAVALPHAGDEPRVRPAPRQPTGYRFRRMAWAAMTYYGAGLIWRHRFPHYRHHKEFSPFPEIVCWVRSALRKQWFRVREAALRRFVSRDIAGRYFLVPLQVFNDSQIRHHSPFEDVRDFIEDVIVSFARHAPRETHLVIKHHPMDRGHRDYRRWIASLTRTHGLSGRIHYLHDAHVPSLITKSRGVVTINSTTGLSALNHGCPVYVAGRAFFDLPGLTSQMPLAVFWRSPAPVDRQRVSQLKTYLLSMTQHNGSFYGDSPWMRAQDAHTSIINTVPGAGDYGHSRSSISASGEQVS
ncbi:capsule biosynthesis protein [Pandoraea sp. NPDC087047]|uniref:capsule biosynthesis protein n=1 Tax=Pandoraea sp. NPDC087047 TaxID=3364390 RepID=UPI0038038640